MADRNYRHDRSQITVSADIGDLGPYSLFGKPVIKAEDERNLTLCCLNESPQTTSRRSTGRVSRLTPTSTKNSVELQTLAVPFPSHLSQQQHEQQQQQQQQQQHQHQSQQQVHRASSTAQTHIQQSTSNSSGSNESVLAAFVGDPLRSLSSMRPIGDEVTDCYDTQIIDFYFCTPMVRGIE
ncbi:unnamed protein product [Echinostoma caproni]|uniref:Protein grainyhead n=1 Tax=Echinostoma caproni TaxID=27848 RepID=A0A183AQ48_9TREM|nr:unnamed protein product [Echinostoma caproni]